MPPTDLVFIGFVIAGSLVGQIQVSSLVGGAVFNPAVAFALHMNALFTVDNEETLNAVNRYAYVFYLATFGGGMLAAFF